MDAREVVGAYEAAARGHRRGKLGAFLVAMMPVGSTSVHREEAEVSDL